MSEKENCSQKYALFHRLKLFLFFAVYLYSRHSHVWRSAFVIIWFLKFVLTQEPSVLCSVSSNTFGFMSEFVFEEVWVILLFWLRNLWASLGFWGIRTWGFVWVWLMGFYLNSCLYGISCKFAAEGACREALAAFFFFFFFFSFGGGQTRFACSCPENFVYQIWGSGCSC